MKNKHVFSWHHHYKFELESMYTDASIKKNVRLRKSVSVIEEAALLSQYQ